MVRPLQVSLANRRLAEVVMRGQEDVPPNYRVVLSIRFLSCHAENGGLTFLLGNNVLLSRTNHSLAHTSVHAAAHASAVSRPRCIECERASP